MIRFDHVIRNGSLDRNVVYISVHRQEQDALLEILNEVIEKDVKVEILERINQS